MASQMKVPQVGGAEVEAGGRKVWMDPSRDLAHAFPKYLQMAEKILLDAESASKYLWQGLNLTAEDYESVAGFLERYIQVCSNCEVNKQDEALKAAGLTEVPVQALAVFSHALMYVLLAGYFHGSRQAMLGDKTNWPNFDIALNKQG